MPYIIKISKMENYKSRIFTAIITVLLLGGCAVNRNIVREQIEWSDFWWKNEPDNSKPRILFIGNSITRGYYPMVEEKLSEKYNCDRYTSSRSIVDPSLIQETKMAMGKYDHCIIHFNNGLHGFHLAGADYEAGMRKYVKFLKSHKSHDSKLVYSLTTPVPSKEEGVKLDADKNAVVLERNRIARKIMEENNIPVIDLYGLMEPELEKYSASKGNVHYNKQGNEKLAGLITERLLNLVKSN
jgi:hypothetical protein